MKNKLYPILKLLRPKQWLKNFAIFGALIFTDQLFNGPAFMKVLVGFIVFCGLSSAVYVLNDIFDRKRDRLHPFKRFRPIAKGDISVSTGILIFILLTIGSLLLAATVRKAFFFTVLAYLIMHFLYSLYLKHIEVIDILIVATGYMLRIYGGEFASSFHISVWLLLTAIALSLFLAVGKRKSELTLISHLPDHSREATRQTLSHYSDQLLDIYASIFATSTFVFYSLFTFLESSSFKPSIGKYYSDFLPEYFQRKWLMVTIIPVAYGLMRYVQDIYEKHEGESPEKVLLSDIPLLTSVLIWVFLVIVILYFIGG